MPLRALQGPNVKRDPSSVILDIPNIHFQKDWYEEQEYMSCRHESPVQHSVLVSFQLWHLLSHNQQHNDLHHKNALFDEEPQGYVNGYDIQLEQKLNQHENQYL